MQISDILTIDLKEDIKNVIDIEDFSEKEILTEIENYIVTDGLAREYYDFATTFTSNIVETGVWISGFYGSGKTYFGKLLGYMLGNPIIAGTPARSRILQRFIGIDDEALVKNSISRLDSGRCRVIMLNVAKQDTSKGFSYTLFRNFLKSLDLPENEHGMLLFQLMLDEELVNISEFIRKHLQIEWSDIRSKLTVYFKLIQSIFLSKGNTESDYENMMTTIRREMDQFDAARVRDKLEKYLAIVPDEKIVFLFDEASEAIEQKKYTLLDLEGISESLTALGTRVWTIAIAQERLDDIINNSNISKAKIQKVTDRFKTKIHLESTEVDVIIRNRLLRKQEDVIARLKDHFDQNSGKISDHAALVASGISKTETSESYITYYPFYKYQFDLLQNFLFGTKGYTSTKVAARGMIITTYDILRRELQHNRLFDIATGWQIAKEAQPQPHVRLVNRYDNAEKILRESGSSISGRKLLETIHFLSEAEVVPTSLPNILKSFVSDPDAFYQVQEEVGNALKMLTEARVLLETNKTYRITSDIEQRLMDEMNEYTIQSFVRKGLVVTAYKTTDLIKSLARITDKNLNYDFYITTDNDDELTNPAKKQLKVKLKSIYNISDNRTADIDAIKVQHQNDKDVIWIAPDNRSFREIDKLSEEIKRIQYLEEKYQNPESDEAPIVRSFSQMRSDKEIRLRELVEQSLQGATAVYLFNTFLLHKDNFVTTLQAQQRQVIQNVYHKRLNAQLSDATAASVIKEANAARLHQYFHGDDFAFFDSKGNFVGDNLKVSEEIAYKFRNTFVDGLTLEKELELPPTGFSFGTVISTVAALMRAGKVMAKHNGAEKFSWRDEGVSKIFSSATEFRKASFKAISKSLTALQRQQLAQILLDIDSEKYTGKKVDYNTNDFELVGAVRELARHFCDKVTNLQGAQKDFDKLFPSVEAEKEKLCQFTGAVSEGNYIERAEGFLAQQDAVIHAVQHIEKVSKFIRNRLPQVREWHSFVQAVGDELSKAAIRNTLIDGLIQDFGQHYLNDIVRGFANLQQIAQKVKDEYHRLFQDAGKESSAKYKLLQDYAEAVIKEIESLPAGLNLDALYKVQAIMKYAANRTQSQIQLDFDVKDKQSKFTLSEVLSFIEIHDKKNTELDIILAGLSREPIISTDQQQGKKSKQYTSKLPGSIIKVKEYRYWLKTELGKLASAGDDDEVVFDK